MKNILIKKLKPVWHGHFYSSRYPSVWIDNIREVPRVVKAFVQRGRHGVAERDCWNLDNYLCNVLKNGLQIYKKDTIGYPGFLTEEEWDNVIDRMIELVEIIEVDPIDSPLATFVWERGTDENMKWKKEVYKERWLKNVKRYAEYRQECLDELCDLMKQYFFDLWW